MSGTYLHLDNIPLLTASRGKWLPYFLAHAHVLLAKPFKLPVIEVVLASALHKTFMSFSAGITGLGRKGFTLDLVPVLAHRTHSQ